MVLPQLCLHAPYFMLSLSFTVFFSTHRHVCAFDAERVQAAATHSRRAIYRLYKAAGAGLIVHHACIAAQLPPSQLLGGC